MHSSTDNGLTPSYQAAPEIGQHQHHHFHHGHNQDYGTIETNYTDPPLYRNADEVYLQNKEDDDSNTVANTFATIFRFVFTLIFFATFAAIALSFYRSYSDHKGDYTPSPIDSRPSHPSSPPRTIDERVKNILDSTPLIDGHNDLAIFIRERYHNDIGTDRFKDEFVNGPMPLNVDLPRLREGMSGGAFWSAFVACPVNASYDMTDENYAVEVSHTLEQIDVLRRLQHQYPTTFSSAQGAYITGSGREHMLAEWRYYKSFFGPISIEGLHQVLPSAPMSTLREYYALGVRMATLTWNCHNPFADAAIVWNSFKESPKVVNGVFRSEGAVTKRGREVIREMNRIGMIIDISHTSYWTQKAVLQNNTSRAPVVFSHSSAYSLCPHPRNVRDDILDLVPKSNSLVMVNFSPDFISCKSAVDGTEGSKPYFELPTFYEKNNTLHQVARHIKYIGDRIGYDHVGVGSDFDGMGEKTPEGLDGVDKFPSLVAELLRMGISDKNVEAVIGGNLLRVWKDVDDVSAQMQREGVAPGVDDGSGF